MRPFFACNEPGPLLDRMRAAGIECRSVPMRNPYDIAAARNLAKICEELRIDIIHTNYLRENYIAIFAKLILRKGLKIIYTNHFVTPVKLPVKIMNGILTRLDHRIISVCEAGVPRLLANGNAKSKIIVVHNAVDPSDWRPGVDYGEIRARARRELNIGADEKVFLCASRFAHDKGHKFLIDSVKYLKDRYGVDKMKILLAGDGPLESDIKMRVESAGLAGVIRFLGFTPDIKPLFYASDVYLNPSQHEALSFLIIEALASGLPVIAADMGGNREIVNDRHNCGILVEYGDAEAYGEAIQALRTNDLLMEEKKSNAIPTVERHFSLEDMLAKTFASFY